MNQVMNIIRVLIHDVVSSKQNASIVTDIFPWAGEFSPCTYESDVFRNIKALELFFASEACQVLKGAELSIFFCVEVDFVSYHD